MAESETFSSKIFCEGNTAVITGASSGIGKSAAYFCASKTMKVYMLDIDDVMLKDASDQIRKAFPNASVFDETVDVSDFEAMKAIAEKVFSAEKEGRCHFLMNNAGIHGGGGGSSMTPINHIHKTLGVNTYGPIHGCQVFLPLMKKQGSDTSLIVNTGSKQGITMPPGNLIYNVSKAALKTYTEGLEHELRTERMKNEDFNIYAALLVPGWVNTSIVLKEMRAKAQEDNSEFDVEKVFFHEKKPAAGAWMGEQVIEFMTKELDNGRFYIICPDNDVDRETDNLRMTWTMQDITMNRPPLSRWHPDYKEKFSEFLAENKK